MDTQCASSAPADWLNFKECYCWFFQPHYIHCTCISSTDVCTDACRSNRNVDVLGFICIEQIVDSRICCRKIAGFTGIYI